MNEQRCREYLNLINSILQAHTEEQLHQLFAKNQSLFNEELVQVMLYVANESEDEYIANYLRNFANDLAQQQRTKQYVTLINSIVEVESDEQLQQLFAENESLIDEGLIQTMVYLADMIEDKDENRANHLRNMANNTSLAISKK